MSGSGGALSRSPEKMTTEELVELVIKFRRAVELERMCRDELTRRYTNVDDLEPVDPRLELMPGRKTRTWDDEAVVIGYLDALADKHEHLSIYKMLRPLSVRDTEKILKGTRIPKKLRDQVKTKVGDPFIKLKPQDDAEMFGEEVD